jgi:hypothetical protein
MVKKILGSSYMVLEYGIQFKLPNVLKVDVILKKPFFALKNRASGQIALVDKEGTVLAVSDTTTFPVVITNDNLPKPSEKTDGKSFLALTLIDGVHKMYQTMSGIIEGNTFLVELPGPIRVIFPLIDADRDLLLGSLKLVYSNTQNRDGVLYKEIDLRYKNPVLR